MSADFSDSSKSLSESVVLITAEHNQDSEDAIATVDRPQPKRWRWLIVLLLLPLGVFVGRSLLNRSPVSQAEPIIEEKPSLPVQTESAELISSYTIQRSYTGEIVARRRSELGFERSGTVINLFVDEGDRISAGQEIAQLDIRTLEAERQQLLAQKAEASATLQELRNGARAEDIAAARATVSEIKQQLSLAQRKTERRRELYLEGAISREDFDLEESNASALSYRLNQAQSDLDALLAGTRKETIAAQVARVQQLEASLQSLEVEVSKSVIRAPFNGRVSDRFMDEGSVVSPGTPAIALIEQGSLEARIGVPSNTANELRIGANYPIQVANQSYRGTLTTLLPELDSASRTATAVLEFSPNFDLRVGETAQLLWNETQAIQGFWIPSTALLPGDRGLWSIYVLGESQGNNIYRVARRDIEVLHTEGDRTLVRGTLQSGDRIITSGTHRIVSGQKVSIN